MRVRAGPVTYRVGLGRCRMQMPSPERCRRSHSGHRGANRRNSRGGTSAGQQSGQPVISRCQRPLLHGKSAVEDVAKVAFVAIPLRPRRVRTVAQMPAPPRLQKPVEIQLKPWRGVDSPFQLHRRRARLVGSHCSAHKPPKVTDSVLWSPAPANLHKARGVPSDVDLPIHTRASLGCLGVALPARCRRTRHTRLHVLASFRHAWKGLPHSEQRRHTWVAGRMSRVYHKCCKCST